MKIQLRKREPKKRLVDFRYKKEALAIAIAVLVTILVLILTSGGPETPAVTKTPVSKAPDIKTKIYSAGDIYLEYPETWKITTDEINNNNMQLVIQDPSSVGNPDSTKVAGFTVFKVEKDPYQTLEQRKESFIQSIRESGANINLISSNNTNLNGINAVEAIYEGTGPKNEQIQLKVIYFEQNNLVYILAFLTRGMNLQSQKANFDVVINSFKLQ
ncbi:MAG: PsbP-related protein [Methanobacterium sp.]|nr:PsbP-related protein [Methanobacterium sp.]